MNNGDYASLVVKSCGILVKLLVYGRLKRRLVELGMEDCHSYVKCHFSNKRFAVQPQM